MGTQLRVLIESFLLKTNMTSGVFKIRYVLVLLTIVALALEVNDYQVQLSQCLLKM